MQVLFQNSTCILVKNLLDLKDDPQLKDKLDAKKDVKCFDENLFRCLFAI